MNFRVARNVFGDYWVGSTDEPVDGEKVFAQLKQAQNKAVLLTDNRDDLSDDDRYIQIDEIKSETVETIQDVPKSGRW